MLAIAAVLVLILVGTVTAGLLVRSRAAATYAIGSCVTHSGSKPKRVSCSTAGAYQVTDQVDDPGRCAADNPYIEVDHSPHNRIFCLRPATK